MIVDCAVYDHGCRREGEVPFHEALDLARSSPDAFVWIELHEPSTEEFAGVSEEFELHPLAVEDAVNAHQRPKVEGYGSTLFVVLKPARYVDSEEIVTLCEIMLFLGDGFLVTVGHGASPVLREVGRTLEADPARLEWGPVGVLHAVMDRVVDDYGAVMRGLDADIEEIERQVFSDTRENHGERIYSPRCWSSARPWCRSSTRSTTWQRQAGQGRDRAARLLPRRARPPHPGGRPDRVHRQPAHQRPHRRPGPGRAAPERGHAQMSAWVAIVAVPTMIAGIYGMNFEHMPELGWAMGYPFALGLMAACSISLYVLFRRREWL